MRLIFVVAIVLFGMSSAVAQPFMPASPHGGDFGEPSSFTFSDGGRTCEIGADGRGMCRRSGGRDWPFRLPTEDGRISALSFIALGTDHGTDLLIGYELDDGEGGWGKIVRMRRGSKRPAWRFHVRGLNMAVPVLHDHSIVVAALAFLARIEVETGWSEWRLERAYVGGGYEIPEISIAADQVIVLSRDGSSGNVRTECFHIDSGACASCRQ